MAHVGGVVMGDRDGCPQGSPGELIKLRILLANGRLSLAFLDEAQSMVRGLQKLLYQSPCDCVRKKCFLVPVR